MGYKPHLEFSAEYRKYASENKQDKTKFLIIVVSRQMNQQRNQIVDAVKFKDGGPRIEILDRYSDAQAFRQLCVRVTRR
ncbi:hypothetical protein V2J09_011021 [Rumex salicifolius]